MEENKFEGKWRAAMEGAEVQPSETVWSSVESALIAAENVTMRRRVVFYQRLAAACLLFALTVGAAGFYFGKNNAAGDENLVLQNQSPKSNHVTPEVPLPNEKKRLTEDNKEVNEKVIALSDKPDGERTTASVVKQKHHAVISRSPSADSVDRETSLVDRDEPLGNNTVETIAVETKSAETRSAETKSMEIKSAENKITSPGQTDENLKASVAAQTESPLKNKKQEEESIVLPGLNNAVDEPDAIKKYPRRNSEDVWASVGFAAGNYNPGSTTLNNNSQTQMFNNAASNQGASGNRPASGSAYSIGFVLGKRVSDRWVIQGGVNYLNQNSGNVSVVTASSSNNQSQALDLYNLSAKPTSSVTFTSPYQINSTLEFISVPVQAGYLLVNRKVGFQMNGGVAADFFIRNSLADPSGQVNSYSQGAGSDSPYRTLNWAGLVSSELSYRVGRQYRVSLVPGVRYLFNSSLKSGATSNSYMADIGFRFRYILR